MAATEAKLQLQGDVPVAGHQGKTRLSSSTHDGGSC